MKRKEVKYYGIHACLKLFEVRKEDIIRLYLSESNVKAFKPIMKWCSEQKKAYHIISNAELERVTESVHHEGVCLLARSPEFVPFEKLDLKQEKMCLLYLDGVQNPHNIGSIVRTSAHFGMPYILGETGKLPELAPSAYRIAKGGAEYVGLVPLNKPFEALKSLKKKGFTLITTSSHGGSPLYDYTFPDRSLIIMGSESEGVSKELFALASQKIQIPGTGLVESLNVSVASALCIAEYFRGREF